MLRNRELILFLLCAAAFTVAAALLSWFFGSSIITVIAGCMSITVLCVVFTGRRYRQITKLNAYLQWMSHGQNALDIRDNTEGELSILKNEIYKVTVSLTEQAHTLSKDKRALAAALAGISHQLKTPLTAISVMADLLDDDQLPPEKRQEFVNNMRTGIHRMDWLALTLLKLARLDAGAVDFKREPVPLSALTERALSPLLIPAEVRDQTITVSGQETTAACDLEWTAEALGNIIKNAVENTPEGGQIQITYGYNPLFAYISVHDSGPGIAKADLPHLFQRFYRGKNAGNESAGIGLSMSLAVMRKQNGDIEASNDAGSVFTLKFYRGLRQ